MKSILYIMVFTAVHLSSLHANNNVVVGPESSEETTDDAFVEQGPPAE